MCMTKSLDTAHEILCPKSFIRYKTECYYHSLEKGDYNKSEVLCAEKGSRITPIKDRATYQFLRSWSIKQNFGDFYLGKCNQFSNIDNNISLTFKGCVRVSVTSCPVISFLIQIPTASVVTLN